MAKVTMHLAEAVQKKAGMSVQVFKEVSGSTIRDCGGLEIIVPSNENPETDVTYFYPSGTFTRLKFED